MGSEGREIWVQIPTLTRRVCAHRLTVVYLAGLLWALNMIADIKPGAPREDKEWAALAGDNVYRTTWEGCSINLHPVENKSHKVS